MTTPANYVHIEGKLRFLDPYEFERFCFQLLDAELDRRHINASIGGPPEPYRGDKGEDIRIDLTEPPRVNYSRFAAPITPDHIGHICISCKGGTGYRKEAISDSKTKPALADTIKNGGYIVFMIGQRVAPQMKTELIFDCAKAVAKKLKIDIAQVENRIDVVDASDLALFMSHHQVMVDEILQTKLDIRLEAGLLTLPQWGSEFASRRGLPNLELDKRRKTFLNTVSHSLDFDSTSTRVTWVAGPPGIGKSRLVYEALLAHSSADSRSAIASDFEHGSRAVYEGRFITTPESVLVVDECPPEEVDAIASRFIARTELSNSLLIIIGPIGKSVSVNAPVQQIVLDPLDSDASGRLIENEIAIAPGANNDLVNRVIYLAEGYPWFAVLLARALREDPDALPEGATRWEATALALAGPVANYGGDKSAQTAEIYLRARTLMAVILTENVEWSVQDQSAKDQIAAAVGLDWPTLSRTVVVCDERGLIRTRLQWRYKYITPNNIAREIAIHLIGRPHSITSSVREFLPERIGPLVTKLDQLEFPSHLSAELASFEMAAAKNPFDLTHSSDDTILMFLARSQPAETARWIRVAIEEKGLDELVDETSSRRPLMFALNHIVRRKEGFEDAERAIFKLAAAESEDIGNNATSIWSSLFAAVFHLTHQDFDSRLTVLRKRAFGEDETLRLIALGGVGTAVSWEHSGPLYGHDDLIDGQWPMSTRGEARNSKKKAWCLLFELTKDESETVAQASRSIVIENVSAAVHWGLSDFVFPRVSEYVAHWTEEERAELWEQISELIRREGQEFASNQHAVRTLADVLRPTTFRERLRDTVGRWYPGEQRPEDENWAEFERDLDKRIAVEGLQANGLLLEELEWLESEDAVRSIPFMIVAGEVDTDRLLLQPLESIARTGGAVNTLSAYVRGIYNIEGNGVVDELLASWRDIDQMAQARLTTMARVGSNDQRVEWLLQDLKSKILPSDSIGILAMGRWLSGAGRPHAISLIQWLAAQEGLVPKITALEMILGRYGQDAENPDDLDEALSATIIGLASANLTGMSRHSWELAAAKAVSVGLFDAAAQAAFQMVRSAQSFGVTDSAWKIIHKIASEHPELVWREIADLIESTDIRAYRISLEIQDNHLIDAIPIKVIMTWVGTDQTRGMRVAQMTRAHENPLNETARQLLTRFGSRSDVADVLSSRVHSTPGAIMGGFSNFYQSQLENARGWAKDPDPIVAEWGAQRADELAIQHEAELAREEYEQNKSPKTDETDNTD